MPSCGSGGCGTSRRRNSPPDDGPSSGAVRKGGAVFHGPEEPDHFGLAIAVTVFAAVFVSLDLPALTGRAPEVVLPMLNQSWEHGGERLLAGGGSAGYGAECHRQSLPPGELLSPTDRPSVLGRRKLRRPGGNLGGRRVCSRATTRGKHLGHRLVGREFRLGRPGTVRLVRWTPGMTPLIWPSGFPPMRMCWSLIQNRLARPVMRRKTRRTVSLWR